MPSASFVQTLFLGGEWSSYAQGRMESDRYKTALNVTLNGYPREEGGWTRRQGTRWIHHTRLGAAAKLIPFDLSSAEPYQIELSDGFARFYVGASLLLNAGVAVSSFSAATPSVVDVAGSHLLTTGDFVIFTFPNTAAHVENAVVLRNRQFQVTVSDADEFSIKDGITGASIDGSTIGYLGDATMYKIFEETTPYTGTLWQDVRFAQGEEKLILLHPTVEPQVCTITASVPDISEIDFLDGPYMDENTTTTTLDPSGVSGSVTLVASAITGINDGTGFQTTDVGRLVRLLWEPAAWSAAGTYAVGDVVSYEGQYYTAVAASAPTAITPPRNLAAWATASLDVAMWTWGEITARASTTSVTFLIRGDALPDHTARTIWRLGLYSDTTGFPPIGTFHEGRLWLGGVQENRVDASKSNSIYNFAPTSKDGTVADDNAIAAVANAADRHKAVWMKSKDEGIIVGTEGGEWLGRASSTDDPISPTNFKLKPVSKYRAANAEPVLAGSLLLFIQRMGRKVMEWGLPGDQGQITAENLSLPARHIGEVGFEEIVYQIEPLPMLWVLRTDGSLVGCAYKREQNQVYAGWHRITIGGEDRTAVSISVGANEEGTTETLWTIIKAEVDGVHHVEILTPSFEDSREDWQAWFLDKGTTPSGGVITSYGSPSVTYVRFYGLWPLEGEEVTVVVGGLDCGEFTVANGYVDVPITGASAVLTAAFLMTLTDAGVEYTGQSVVIGEP